MDMPDGHVGHAEVGYQDNVVMLATAWTAAGMTTMVAEPRDTDHGDRSYRAVDPEGRRWIFATRSEDAG